MRCSKETSKELAPSPHLTPCFGQDSMLGDSNKPSPGLASAEVASAETKMRGVKNISEDVQ